MGNKVYKFENGSIWENYPWQIEINCTCDNLIGNVPCSHARNLRETEERLNKIIEHSVL